MVGVRESKHESDCKPSSDCQDDDFQQHCGLPSRTVAGYWRDVRVTRLSL
jgi:hypothetical protein